MLGTVGKRPRIYLNKRNGNWQDLPKQKKRKLAGFTKTKETEIGRPYTADTEINPKTLNITNSEELPNSDPNLNKT